MARAEPIRVPIDSPLMHAFAQFVAEVEAAEAAAEADTSESI